MSVAALTYVWENSKQEGGSLLVMLALADYANDRGESFPSNKTLARKARLGERHTQRVVQQLLDSGEISLTPNGGPNGVNIYRIIRGGDKMSGVTPVSPGGDAQVPNGETPKSPKPSGTVKEPSPAFTLESGDGKRKKQRKGTINGTKPSQEMVEAFAISLGMPKSDGTAMYWHFIDKNWKGVNNWEATVRKWKEFGYLPSQKNSKFQNGRGMTPAPTNTEPRGFREWLAGKPDYQRLCQGVPYTGCREFIRREFAAERKAAAPRS